MLNEDAAHLMVCPSVHRTTLFQQQVEELDTWMKTHHTEPHLRKSIRLYLACRGKRKFSAIWGMPIGMKQLAWEQDCIGWRHFTEGKICKEIRARQEMYLRRRRTNLTADSWTKSFVERLLAMNHKQWIFRCTTKHHRTKGTKVLANQRDVLRKIERQLATGVRSLAP